MPGFEMFCERCGKRYGSGEAPNSTSLPLSKRLLKAVGVSAGAPAAPPVEPLLRFCLACRGYSCAECWNDEAGFCQTCVPVEVPVVEQPVLDTPVLPAPQMSFETYDEMPPYLAMLASQTDTSSVDPSGEYVAEPHGEAEAELALAEDEPTADPVVEPMLTVADEADVPQSAEDDLVAAEALGGVEVVGVEALADVEAVDEVELAAASEASDEQAAADDESVAADEAVAADESVAAESVTAEDTAPMVVAAATLAMDERPIELVFADEEMSVEPEETTWDWDFVAETDAGPSEASEPVVEPAGASADEGQTDAGTLVDAPVVLPPPVYRPLPPLGPIMPPPPPPVSADATPRMEFEVMEPPPAFVIAPPQAQALMRPQLPAGLFDGPGPQIRPCHQCELPVSAKARFCRRCGTAQPSN